MVLKITVWMLLMLVTCGASFGMYDDNPISFNQDGENYSDDNYNYIDPVQYGPESLENPTKSIMLYHLFNALQNRDDMRLGMQYRPKFNMVENPMASFAHVPFPDLDLKGAMVKKQSNAPTNAPANTNDNPAKPSSQQQPKSKGKARKFGSHVICYFKLCTLQRWF